LLVGLDGCVFEVNLSFKELTGFDDSFIGQNLLAGHLIKQDSMVGLPTLGSDWSGCVDFQKPDGSKLKLFLEWLGLKDPDGQPSGYFVIARCFNSEGSSQSHSPRSMQSQKLESLGMFTGSIAHDLNNLLAGVLGHVSYLRMSLSKDGSHVESVTAIEDAARRAASLTKQVLEYARGATVELTKINLSSVAASAVQIVKGSIPEDIELSFNSGPSELFIMGEENQLTQVVMNLVVNARDALANGGKIKISIEKISIESAEQVDKFGVPSGIYAKISVSDNGSGIPDSVRDKIFDPFFTTKLSRGTGIGLATVMSVVKFHSGTVICESEVGKGTSFEIFLPLLEEVSTSAAQPPKKSPDHTKQWQGTEKVLVVDDEDSVRTIIQRSLTLLGYEVDVASSGAEAVAKYQKNGNYDLVILDMIMPKMAGEEVFRQLSEIDPNVAVLIASGYSSDGRTKKILSSGGLGYIQKPFAVEELATEVRRCLTIKAKQ
jgi:signal transduction histidine kinase/ActR/RegA family two-component response regulator